MIMLIVKSYSSCFPHYNHRWKRKISGDRRRRNYYTLLP